MLKTNSALTPVDHQNRALLMQNDLCVSHGHCLQAYKALNHIVARVDGAIVGVGERRY